MGVLIEEMWACSHFSSGSVGFCGFNFPGMCFQSSAFEYSITFAEVDMGCYGNVFPVYLILVVLFFQSIPEVNSEEL